MSKLSLVDDSRRNNENSHYDVCRFLLLLLLPLLLVLLVLHYYLYYHYTYCSNPNTRVNPIYKYLPSFSSHYYFCCYDYDSDYYDDFYYDDYYCANITTPCVTKNRQFAHLSKLSLIHHSRVD